MIDIKRAKVGKKIKTVKPCGYQHEQSKGTTGVITSVEDTYVPYVEDTYVPYGDGNHTEGLIEVRFEDNTLKGNAIIRDWNFVHHCDGSGCDSDECMCCIKLIGEYKWEDL